MHATSYAVNSSCVNQKLIKSLSKGGSVDRAQFFLWTWNP